MSKWITHTHTPSPGLDARRTALNCRLRPKPPAPGLTSSRKANFPDTHACGQSVFRERSRALRLRFVCGKLLATNAHTHTHTSSHTSAHATLSRRLAALAMTMHQADDVNDDGCACVRACADAEWSKRPQRASADFCVWCGLAPAGDGKTFISPSTMQCEITR